MKTPYGEEKRCLPCAGMLQASVVGLFSCFGREKNVVTVKQDVRQQLSKFVDHAGDKGRVDCQRTDTGQGCRLQSHGDGKQGEKRTCFWRRVGEYEEL